MGHIVLVDDRRVFRDARAAQVVRESGAAMKLLESMRESGVSELWLDHDLGADPAGVPLEIWPVVDLLCEWASEGRALSVDRINVHSSNPPGKHRMVAALARWGYPVRSSNLDELTEDPDLDLPEDL